MQIRTLKLISEIKSCFMLNLQPDLSGNPFLLTAKFYLTENVCKKDWERKAEIAAQT